MIRINVSGFLTDFTGGRSTIELESSPSTVGQALDELWRMYPGLRDRVVTEQGHVRTHVNVFLKDENIRRKKLLATPLPDDSEITILPSVSGGGLCLKSSESHKEAQKAQGFPLIFCAFCASLWRFSFNSSQAEDF